MRLAEWNGASWDESRVRGPETLADGNAWFGAQSAPSLAIDPNGNLAIAVQDTIVEQTWWGIRTNGVWEVEDIASSRLMAAQGWGSTASVHFDHAGRVVVVWYDNSYGGHTGISALDDGVWREQISIAHVTWPLSTLASGYNEHLAIWGGVLQLADGRLAWTVSDAVSGDLFWIEDQYRVCPTAATPFTDVSGGSYAAADVACIYGLGITTGTSETEISPGDP